MKFKEISLLTNRINEMKNFYRDILGLRIITQSSDYFTVKVGFTSVTFKQSPVDSEPFYHFAINIPENKMAEAKFWIQTKVELTKEENLDEVFFKSWNAHAIYFEDPSGNIIELIARHNLKNGVEHIFSSEDILNISEIGVVTDEVIPMVRKLNELGIPNWKEDSEGLTPVGDEMGLFIIVKSNRRWYFSEQAAKFHPFSIEIEGMDKLTFSKKNSIG